MSVGQPPKPYFLDIDTGSDLTWLQCDAPCTKCTPVTFLLDVFNSLVVLKNCADTLLNISQAPHTLYKPKKNLITCLDPVCAALHGPENLKCEAEEQCDYEVDYADHGSSLGVLVKDTFPLRFTNGSTVAPQLAFG